MELDQEPLNSLIAMDKFLVLGIKTSWQLEQAIWNRTMVRGHFKMSLRVSGISGPPCPKPYATAYKISDPYSYTNS